MKYAVCMVFGYLLGAISPAAFFSKIKRIDLREHGSGNMGGTNTFLVIGKRHGVFVMLFDIAKAFAASRLAKRLFPELAQAGLLAGYAAVIGHIFPFYMGFKGGKGLAAFGGMILAADQRIFCVLLTVGLGLILLTSRSVVLPVSASLLFPVLLWLHTGSYADLAVALAASLLVLIAHRGNIKKAFVQTDMPVKAYIKSKFFKI